MQDLVLAWAHHVAIFVLVAIFVAELTLVRVGMSAADVRRVSKVDLWYGVIAGVVVIIGGLRAVYGGKGWAFYQDNPLFWLKVGLFVIVGLLSVPPTIAYIRWRGDQKTDTDLVPADSRINTARRWLIIEGVFLAAIPLTAAAMARYPF